jgi:outer membrane receptor protein involved in Fe transport
MLPYSFIWVLLITLFLNDLLLSQDIFIAGEIRSKKTEEIISDVNIYLLEESLGTTSDEYGQFYLKIPIADQNLTVVFHHIGYDTLQVPLSKAKTQRLYYLIPRVMTGTEITVLGKYEEMDIAKDLPIMTTVLDERKFENQAYTDAGDLLKTEQSIQIEEDLSGRKTIAMRGGNADDVIVLYNGVKLNNPYDNTFDLSLINLDDIKQVEVIKGNNTSLYGSDAFSGIINIVPKVNNDYSVRFAQRFGTYDSGDWNLQLNHSFKNKLFLLYSHKEGGSRRTYADSPDDSEFLENKSSHQTFNMVYSLSNNPDNSPDDNISAMYMRSKLSYRNNRYYEGVLNLNQLASLRFVGDIGIIKNVNIIGSYQWFDHDQQIPTVTGLYRKYFDNQSLKLNLEKTFTHKSFSLLLGYQYENSNLEFKEERNYLDDIAVGLESVYLTRQKHGLVSILKLQPPTGSDYVRTADIDASFRYDNVWDEQRDVVIRNIYNELDFYPGLVDSNKWDVTMLKLSAHFAGSFNDFGFNAYVGVGSNYKFPSLFQQLSAPIEYDDRIPEITTSLQPEKNRSTEFGFEILHETKKIPQIDNWEASLSYFNNLYDNKFRMFYIPGNPVAFYDNVPNAHISGIETRFKMDFFQQQITAEIGYSHYSISDKAAFPFKSDEKYILNLISDYRGFFFRFHGFIESAQKGWFRSIENLLTEVQLPGYTNIDIIVGKTFEFKFIKFITNFAVRNLLDDDTQIFGISIRDRRYYVLVGVEF